MHYLKCIAICEYLQRKLYARQRQQVPVESMGELQNLLVSLRKRLENENNLELTTAINDMMLGVNQVKQIQGIQFLPEKMKDSLVEGVIKIQRMISMKAFTYFQVNEFEPTEQIIPIMRTVVRIAYEEGAL